MQLGRVVVWVDRGNLMESRMWSTGHLRTDISNYYLYYRKGVSQFPGVLFTPGRRVVNELPGG